MPRIATGRVGEAADGCAGTSHVVDVPWQHGEAGHADPITLVGMVLETAAGLRRELTPNLERELGVGGQSFEILVRLGRSAGGRLRMSDLAAQTGLTPSGLTRAVDRLVGAGLLERETCPSDRRVAFALLTPTGRHRTADALSSHERDVAEVLGGVLTSNEEALLVDLLRKVRDRVHPDAALVSDPVDQAS